MSESCNIKVGADGRVQLSGELTFESTPNLYRQTEALFRDNRTIDTIDLAGITTVDSAGLALMLEWQAGRVAAGKELRFRNAPSSLVSLAQLCEAFDLLGITGRQPNA